MTACTMAACILILCTGHALADTLPLRHGAYVSEGTDCKDPPNVALRTYDGRGLGSSVVNDCRGRVLSRLGNVFQIEQDCREYGGPKLERGIERSTIRVDGPNRYTDLTGGSGESFRFCPGLKP
ncbi:hypothetical protein [Methylobacterium aquaticum]|uniref:hypothetical protein n=1 Tax=Methylobacterium aquaticum TaxID=270351 RepID=UPI0019345B67|nr:hypothetical protein [Methylobacterium aquaticum]QRE74887.1 hypothetical protein F1D61_15945 [Methylobacterium aquaticum]